jgi:hypothetical protein
MIPMTWSMKVTWVTSIASFLTMAYFTLNQEAFKPTEEETAKLIRMQSQVSFRDPKLIEEHQKKLDALNAKNAQTKNI